MPRTHWSQNDLRLSSIPSINAGVSTSDSIQSSHCRVHPHFTRVMTIKSFCPCPCNAAQFISSNTLIFHGCVTGPFHSHFSFELPLPTLFLLSVTDLVSSIGTAYIDEDVAHVAELFDKREPQFQVKTMMMRAIQGRGIDRGKYGSA